MEIMNNLFEKKNINIPMKIKIIIYFVGTQPTLVENFAQKRLILLENY
jgi:hypothetical protein